MDPQTQPVAAWISKLLAIREHLLTLLVEMWIKQLEHLVTTANPLCYVRIKGYSSTVGRDDTRRGIG